MAGTIQTGIDLLPATGAEVKLLDGTYSIKTGLVLDSYQTLRGCGRNTIFIAETANLDIITATGSSGSEKVGITLADFCIDGDGDQADDEAILWTYVDYSLIRNIWSRDNGQCGIYLVTSDHNNIIGAVCRANTTEGIYLYNSNYNIIGGNTNEGNTDCGIYLSNGSSHNTISINNCEGNGYGIELDTDCEDNTITGNPCQGNIEDGIYILDSDGNTVIGNPCQGNKYGIELCTANNCVISNNNPSGNGRHGIYLRGISDNNTISINNCTENSQDTDDTYDDIYLVDASYNTIQGNTCRAGGEANKPRYGINISDSDSTENKVINNDLYNDGSGTAPYNDSGTGTIYKEPANYLDLPEIAEPGNPTTNNLRLFTLADNGFSVLSFKDDGGMVRQFMRDSIFIAYNETGDTIAANRAVYASGSTDGVPTLALAKADSSDTMPAIGVTIDEIADSAYGRVMQVGLLEDVNTLAFSAGDVLYVSAATAGMPTATPPSYPNIRQQLGTVLVDSETVGAIQIVARSAFDDSVISIVPSLENPPTEDEDTKAPTSEWAFDHDADTDAHHAQQHAITSTSDHTSTATEGQVLQADANGLPVDASNTDTEVADAVTKAHTQLCEAADFTKLDGIEALADVTADHDPKAHAASHCYLGADMLIGAWFNLALKKHIDSFFESMDEWTQYTSGSGAITVDMMQTYLSTGATQNSRSAIYTALILPSRMYLIATGISVRTDPANWETRIWVTHGDGETPVDTEEHVGFTIIDGDIYASCADGAAETREDTGVNVAQWGTYALNVVGNMAGTEFKFYVAHTLTNTISTNTPTLWTHRFMINLLNDDVAANRGIFVFNYTFEDGV